MDDKNKTPAARQPFRTAGIMGWPVSHSRSPLLHGHWLARYGLPGAYIPLPVAPDALPQALEGLAALGFAGCNVTIPHKVAVIPHLHHGVRPEITDELHALMSAGL